MNLREKLKQIESYSKQPKKAPQNHNIINIDKYIDGYDEITPYGNCFVASKFYPSNFKFGSIDISQANTINHETISTIGKDERLKALDLKKTLFFDTETTGLSSGTGTHIFLAGFGYYTENGYVIKQYFLRDFDEEKAFIFAINQLFEKFTGLISYNGKSFDWPQLQTRFIYHRQKNVLQNPLHLDLLHTARRIWKRRLTDCSLQNIERQILNFHRKDDIPGAFIPNIYFQYLQDKNPVPLVKIFQHNILDILALAALFNQVIKIYEAPFINLTDVSDLISLANSFKNLKKWDHAINIYEKLLEKDHNSKIKNEIAYQLSFNYKRLGKRELAAKSWNFVIANGFNKIEPFIELAKYYEHYNRDYKKAENIINQAFKLIDIQEELNDNYDLSDYRNDLTYRLKRIKRKIDLISN